MKEYFLGALLRLRYDGKFRYFQFSCTCIYGEEKKPKISWHVAEKLKYDSKISFKKSTARKLNIANFPTRRAVRKFAKSLESYAKRENLPTQDFIRIWVVGHFVDYFDDYKLTKEIFNKSSQHFEITTGEIL